MPRGCFVDTSTASEWSKPRTPTVLDLGLTVPLPSQRTSADLRSCISRPEGVPESGPVSGLGVTDLVVQHAGVRERDLLGSEMVA